MRQIHRFWIGPPRSSHPFITACVRNLYADAILNDWNIESVPAELRKLLDPQDDPRHLANVVRYWMLLDEGGLWLDHDVLPITNPGPRPTAWTAALRNRREGCAMWFPRPGHPMPAELLKAALAGDPHLPSVQRSGAMILNRIGKGFGDVGLEPGVIPFDSSGRLTHVWPVLAVHLWHHHG